MGISLSLNCRNSIENAISELGCNMECEVPIQHVFVARKCFYISQLTAYLGWNLDLGYGKFLNLLLTWGGLCKPHISGAHIVLTSREEGSDFEEVKWKILERTIC